MKNLLLFIFIFISINSFAQEKYNQEIEIVFKPKSSKLSKVEKEKIRKFVEEHPLDSNYIFCIELINEGCNKKKYSSWNRVNTIIHNMYQVRKINETIYFNSISKVNIDIIKLSYIEKEKAPTHGVPPFPKLRK